MINVYHTDNGIFDTSKFMEEPLKKQQKIRFSGASASHQNGSAEPATKTVVTMESAILMQAWVICHKAALSIDSGQQKWTMLYGSKVGSLIYSMVYKPLGKFEPYMFWSQGFRILEWKPLNGSNESKKGKYGFWQGYSTQVGFIMNMMNGSISLKFHIIFMRYYTMLWEAQPQIQNSG